jgi:hypothetical protein
MKTTKTILTTLSALLASSTLSLSPALAQTSSAAAPQLTTDAKAPVITGTGSLEIVVRDSCGRPVPGIEVEAQPVHGTPILEQALTKRSGALTLKGLRSDSWLIVIYYDQTYLWKLVDIRTGSTARLEIALPINIADVNRDALVNSMDLFDFLNGWTVADAAADFNHDGLINTQDFYDFFNAFMSGCGPSVPPIAGVDPTTE